MAPKQGLQRTQPGARLLCRVSRSASGRQKFSPSQGRQPEEERRVKDRSQKGLKWRRKCRRKFLTFPTFSAGKS